MFAFWQRFWGHFWQGMFDSKFSKRVLFVGIPDMAYICLDGLIAAGVNIVGAFGAKKNHNTYNSFKYFVQSRKVNFIEYESLKDEEFILRIKELKPDVAVVCSFNYKIPKILLEAVPGGFINIHPSLLPKYRGGNPYSPVIMNDEKNTGVTIHFMEETFDTGDIISQRQIPVTLKETMGTLFNRLNLLGLEMLLACLKDFEKGDLPRTRQPEGDFPVGKMLSDEEFFIDFNKSAQEVERFVRSLNPFFNASTFFRSTFVKIFSADVADFDISSQNPVGTIEKIHDNKFFIKTSSGLISPKVLQFGSFFVSDSKDFIKILNLKEGEKFG